MSGLLPTMLSSRTTAWYSSIGFPAL